MESTTIIATSPIEHTKIHYDLYMFMSDNKRCMIIKPVKWHCCLIVDDNYVAIDNNGSIKGFLICHCLAASKRLGKKKLLKQFKKLYKAIKKNT